MTSTEVSLLKEFSDFLNLKITDAQIQLFLKTRQPKNSNSSKLIIYTDGACASNGKSYARGGIGVYFENTDQKLALNVKDVLADYFPHLQKNKVTNNVAELLAIYKALILVATNPNTKNKKITIEIRTDSMYCIKIFTQWIKGWEKKNWITAAGKPVLNKDIITKIWEIVQIIPVTFVHVPAHQSAPPKQDPKYTQWYGNKMADELAVEGAMV